MRSATDITLILDRSGSMQDVKENMDEVLNGFILLQKREPGECTFTLVKFDTEYEVPIRGIPLSDVGHITIEPRGGTALLDAIGQTIDDTGARLAAMPEASRPDKVMIIVVTDGQENSSKKYLAPVSPYLVAKEVQYGTSQETGPASRVNAMVKHQREAYKWNFIFLGADQDAISAASHLGFLPTHAMGYANTSRGVKGMANKISSATTAYRGSATASIGEKTSGGILSTNNQQVTEADATEWDESIAKAKEDPNTVKSTN